MYRKKIKNRYKEKKRFNRLADKINTKNNIRQPMRGGFRL